MMIIQEERGRRSGMSPADSLVQLTLHRRDP